MSSLFEFVGVHLHPLQHLWLSFTLDTNCFLTSFSTCYSTGTLPFRFIIVLVPNVGHWGIMLEIGPPLKSSWKNTSPLLIGCYSFFSSIGLDVRICCGCSWTIGCCNSSSPTSLYIEIDCNCFSTTSWGPIATYSFENEITTYGIGFVVDVVVLKSLVLLFIPFPTPYFSILAQKF